MKTGDYVRIEDGIKRIAKYEYRPEYENCHCIWFKNGNCGLLFTDEELFKSSPNIIDLIEVGDYVNGNKVLAKEENGLLWVFNNDKHDTLYMNKQDIKSILTKEQFESMEYRL